MHRLSESQQDQYQREKEKKGLYTRYANNELDIQDRQSELAGSIMHHSILRSSLMTS